MFTIIGSIVLSLALLSPKLTLAAVFGVGLCLAMWATGPALKDALLKVIRALPNGAATVTSGAIATGKSTALGANDIQYGEYKLTAPALTTGQLANGATMKYNLISSDNADLSAPTTHVQSAIVQTGAGGAGAAGGTYLFRSASDWKGNIGFEATNSGAGDCSGVSATLEFLA